MATPSNPTAHIRYRLRISLLGSEPEIWRTVDVDGTLGLDQLHDVIQITMGWRDSHLHQFMELNPFELRHPLPTIGREPRRWSGENPYDDDPGLPEDEWTIAGTFAELTGPLYYEYDFGDSWIHAVELIESEPYGESEPRAVLLRGERRAPLEDSGGLSGYQEVLDVLENPEHPQHEAMSDWLEAPLGPWQSFDPEALDIEQVNRELVRQFGAISDVAEPAETPPGITAAAGTASASAIASTSAFEAVMERLPASLQREIRGYAGRTGALDPPVIDVVEAARMVEPFAWLMRRAGSDGLALSKAGWLPAAVVSDAMWELSWQDRWYGKFNRESQTMPIAHLRANAQRLGLLRKTKGRLLLTVAAKRILDDPIALWHHLAGAMIVRLHDDAERDATILLALEIASGQRATREDYSAPVGYGLMVLGWRQGDGQDLDSRDVGEILRSSFRVLGDVGAFEHQRWGLGAVTDGGRAFARAMLQAGLARGSS